MNRGEMRAELAYIMTVNEDEADQDFSTTRLNTLIQRAYSRVVLDGKSNGRSEYFWNVTAGTWAADALTLALPSGVAGKQHVIIYDLTDGEPGIEFREGIDFFWKDYTTLQYMHSTTGPSDAITLRFVYTGVAETLASDAATPLLVPPEHCMYIVWTAACMARATIDDQAPNAWLAEREFYRSCWLTYVGTPRPSTAVAKMTSKLYEEDQG